MKAKIIGVFTMFSVITTAQIYTPYGQIQGASGYPGSNGGNLGIGTSSPQAKLHIKANADNQWNASSPPIGITINSTRLQNTSGQGNVDDFTVFNIFQKAVNEFGHTIGNTNAETFKILGNGSIISSGILEASGLRSNNVTISNNRISYSNGGSGLMLNFTSNNKLVIGPTNNSTYNLNPAGAYGLYVVDGILTEEVVVKLEADWPDYVFQPTYRLMPLEELEAFVQNNNHLPKVPSAAVVAKEGQKLGENQKVLLEKIEELTLYLIEMNKELKSAQAKIEALEAKVESATAAQP